MAVEKNGYRLKIVPDDIADNPRDWDNLGHMVCFHRNYILGDTDHGLSEDMFESWVELQAYLYKDLKALAVLPIFLLDHSGISISTSRTYPYDCPWDSGQVGFIYLTKKDLDQAGTVESNPDELLQYLEAEVQIYDYYLRGDVYYYSLEKVDKYHSELIDSCGGYFGPLEESGIWEELKEYGFELGDLYDAIE